MTGKVSGGSTTGSTTQSGNRTRPASMTRVVMDRPSPGPSAGTGVQTAAWSTEGRLPCRALGTVVSDVAGRPRAIYTRKADGPRRSAPCETRKDLRGARCRRTGTHRGRAPARAVASDGGHEGLMALITAVRFTLPNPGGSPAMRRASRVARRNAPKRGTYCVLAASRNPVLPHVRALRGSLGSRMTRCAHLHRQLRVGLDQTSTFA